MDWRALAAADNSTALIRDTYTCLALIQVHTGLGYLFLAKSKKWYEALFTLSTEGCTSGGKLSLFYASLRGIVPLDNAVIEPDVRCPMQEHMLQVLCMCA